jgi:hypothetical protein
VCRVNGELTTDLPSLPDDDLPIYTDGSAHFVGTPHATAGAAAVYRTTGTEIALILRLHSNNSIINAAAAEYWAASLAVILRRQRPTRIVADCQAVLNSLTSPDPINYKAPHAGAWRDQQPHTRIIEATKVRAHQSISIAKEGDWLDHWIGNTSADHWAGQAAAVTNHDEIAAFYKQQKSRRSTLLHLLSHVNAQLDRTAFRSTKRVPTPSQTHHTPGLAKHSFTWQPTSRLWKCDHCHKGKRRLSAPCDKQPCQPFQLAAHDTHGILWRA